MLKMGGGPPETDQFPFFPMPRRKRFVALKVVKSAVHYTETAVDEIKLLKCVSFLAHLLP